MRGRMTTWSKIQTPTMINGINRSIFLFLLILAFLVRDPRGMPHQRDDPPLDLLGHRLQ